MPWCWFGCSFVFLYLLFICCCCSFNDISSCVFFLLENSDEISTTLYFLQKYINVSTTHLHVNRQQKICISIQMHILENENAKNIKQNIWYRLNNNQISFIVTRYLSLYLEDLKKKYAKHTIKHSQWDNEIWWRTSDYFDTLSFIDFSKCFDFTWSSELILYIFLIFLLFIAINTSRNWFYTGFTACRTASH